MFEDDYLAAAKKYTHLAAYLPLWGLLIAFFGYRYVASRRPEERAPLVEAIVWQIFLTVVHFVCVGKVMVAYLFFMPDKPGLVTVVGLSVFVVWCAAYVFGVLTASAAAAAAERGEEFHYPIVSAMLRKQGREPLKRPPGSHFYPF